MRHIAWQCVSLVFIPLAAAQPPAASVPASAKPVARDETAEEAKHYKLTTFNLPDDCVLEVGGLAFRPDGKLLACTRRGDIWLISNPGAANPALVQYSKFATGLHEPLGMYVESNNVVYVVQRPELTKVIDVNGDGVADKFETVCDKWGVSGDYHEFAFGPARDKEGNFFVTLNVGFGGGHQAKVPWRGWCVKVSPDGKLEPYAYGLRSPNGINFAPDGELFYCDNQGEWVATNKLNHVKKGKFYGHQASLRWLPESPFASHPTSIPSGMLYDGQKGPDRNSPSGMPAVDPPAIWFPYGRMGQSASEPVWDTTGGKFGPFAGQCFVGDQTRSTVMRVALEKVNGVYQGTCFPFRNGLQCGVNRLAFGPDGALYVGQTNRGWGSVGGKPYGLQKIAFAGDVPAEVHHVTLTKTGFDLVFTKPIADVTPNAVTLKSFTYIYYSQYGCPEMDPRDEKITAANLSPDRKTISLAVAGLKPGRVYEFRLPDVKTADGAPILHPEAYYTLNELVK
jgi:glucose/arabinose dehydrogenase